MILGCLTGNGKRTPINGAYTFNAPGLTDPLPPDLSQNRSSGTGPHTFGAGTLTDGNTDTGVGWRAATVGEAGVDICVNLMSKCFVDHVVLFQPTSGQSAPASSTAAVSGAEGIEAMGHVEPAGLSCVEVYALSGDGASLRLVGTAGRRGSEVFPEGPVLVSVGVEAEGFVIRLISYQRDLLINEFQVWGAGAGEPEIFPIPRKTVARSCPPFRISEGVAILTGLSATDETVFAASLLSQKLNEAFGATVPTVNQEKDAERLIVIGRPGECSELDTDHLQCPLGSESYVLKVEENRVHLMAESRRGLVYGVETLLQLIQDVDGELTARSCLIEDTPRLEYRGVHLFLPARDQIDFTKRLIRYLLAPMKLNTIFLELAGGMRFDRRPEISEAWEKNNRLAAEGKLNKVPGHHELCGGSWITKDEVKDLVDYARAYGIEVIPEIQSLSHVEYLTMTYPEIAEKEEDDRFPDSYCPLHPDSHKIVFDMIDEVLELLHPLPYLHMGHDEVYTMAECPRCKGKSRDELFAHDVNVIHDYLKEKGVGMMIWADMLQPWQSYAGDRAASMIPKDILLLEFVWYFRTWMDTEDHLLENGFKVILGNCYSSHFTRYEKRSNKEGVIGAQVSVWARTNEEAMGRLGKLYDIIYSANTAWSEHCQDELRWTFDRKISEMMPQIRANLQCEKLPLEGEPNATPIDLTKYYNAPRRDLTGHRGAYDLESLPRGVTHLRNIPVLLGEGVILVEGEKAVDRSYPHAVNIPLGGKAHSIVFAHTCSSPINITQPFGTRPKIGRYEIRYVDGAVKSIDINYGIHLAEWNRRHGQPLGSRHHRHAGYIATYPVDPLWQGKTAHGEDVTLSALEWTNPHPNKALESIKVISEGTPNDASLILAGVTLLSA